MQMREEAIGGNRRYRRSSDRMVALWCLFDHVLARYCLTSAVLIDDFGTALLSVGEGSLVAPTANGEHSFSRVQKMASIPLPGRKQPGLLVIEGSAEIMRPALADFREGIARILDPAGTPY